jgi:hypothetical protein
MTTPLTFTIVPNGEQKQAIVGTLDAIEALIREYVEHLAPRDRLHCQLTFSGMLVWARKREAAKGESDGT